MTHTARDRAARQAAAGYDPAWLDLREPVDARARARTLVQRLRRHLPDTGRLVIYDLGCGTAAMGRWLAGQLPGPQHWVLVDRDPALLDHARTRIPPTSSDGAPVTATTRQLDLAALTPADLGDADLVTASALLDLLTDTEVDRLAQACVHIGCPTLLTLSVTGQVSFDPADPLDGALDAAFNDHQRRRSGDRYLLGPAGPSAAARAFARHGAAVWQRASPWQLVSERPPHRALTAAWLRGWVAAACAQRPGLADRSTTYLQRRLAAVAAGTLTVTIGHRDLLAVPSGGRTMA